MRRGSRGVALLLVMFAGFAIGLFMYSVSTLGSSSRARITHMNKAQTCFLIGSSALAKFMARLHFTSWADRDFKDAPLRQFNVELIGGEYDLYAENSPGAGHDFQADVYIRVRFLDMERLFFWRVQYRDDLLDVSNRFFVKHFQRLPSEEFPRTGRPGFAQQVERVLRVRKANEAEADDLGYQIQGTRDVRDIANILGADPSRFVAPPGFGGGTGGPGSIMIAGIPPIPFPGTSGGFNDMPLTPPRPVPPIVDPQNQPPQNLPPQTQPPQGQPTGTQPPATENPAPNPPAETPQTPPPPVGPPDWQDPIPETPPADITPPEIVAPGEAQDPRGETEPGADVTDITCSAECNHYTAECAWEDVAGTDPMTGVNPEHQGDAEIQRLKAEFDAAKDKCQAAFQAATAAKAKVDEAAQLAEASANPGAVSSLNEAATELEAKSGEADDAAREAFAAQKAMQARSKELDQQAQDQAAGTDPADPDANPDANGNEPEPTPDAGNDPAPPPPTGGTGTDAGTDAGAGG